MGIGYVKICPKYPLGRERRFVLAENAVYHDPQHPSHVVLPLIPAAS